MKGKYISLLAIFLAVGTILCISGIVINAEAKINQDNFSNIITIPAFIPVAFTINIKSDSQYMGDCSFWDDWLGSGDKIFQGRAISCGCDLWLLDPGYLTVEILHSGKIIASGTVTKSVSGGLGPFCRLFALSPMLNLYLLSLFFIKGNNTGVYLIVSIVLLILLYVGSAIVYFFNEYGYFSDIKQGQPPKTYYRKYQNKIIYSEPRTNISKSHLPSHCPYCKAPVEKPTPHDCEYCGRFIRSI